jgi:hypothetical protein
VLDNTRRDLLAARRGVVSYPSRFHVGKHMIVDRLPGLRVALRLFVDGWARQRYVEHDDDASFPNSGLPSPVGSVRRDDDSVSAITLFQTSLLDRDVSKPTARTLLSTRLPRPALVKVFSPDFLPGSRQPRSSYSREVVVDACGASYPLASLDEKCLPAAPSRFAQS